MSTLQIETEIEDTLPTTDAFQLIDCGAASERTQGIPLPVLFELAVPPNNRLLIL